MNTRKGEITLAILLIGSLLAGALGFGAAKLEKVSNKANELEVKNLLLENELLKDELDAPALGAFSPSGGITYRLRTSIGTTDTSINLSSFKNRSDIPLTMTVLGTDIGYGTLSPQTSRSEFISFTGITQNSNGTAQLTGVTRGLSDITPFTASTTLRESHPGQSIFILSDSPQLFEEYALRRSTQFITGAWGFQGTAPTSTTCATPTELCNKAYVDATANAGAATSTEINGGIVELGTISEAASASSSVEIALSEKPRVIQTKDASSSPISVGSGGKHYVVVTTASSTIHPDFIDKTASSTITGEYLFKNASTTFTSIETGTTTIANNLRLSAASTTNEKLWVNGIGLSFASTPLSMFNASGTVPTINSNGNITFRHPEWALLGETTLTGANATITVPIAAEGNDLMVKVYITGANTAIDYTLKFNQYGTYGRRLFENYAPQTATLQNSNHINLAVSTSTAYYATVNVNQQGAKKYVEFQGVSNDTGTILPTIWNGVGVWSTTTAPITQVHVGVTSPDTSTFNTGSRVTVYGRRY